MYKSLLTLFTLNFLFSGILNVPEEYSTIQLGIVFASEGDTVLVAGGDYQGDGNFEIDFFGKSIYLLSNEQATIDLEGSNRAFNIFSQEDSTTVVDGFHIKNGGGVDYGGIAKIHNNSSITFKNCNFENSNSSERRRRMDRENANFSELERRFTALQQRPVARRLFD